MDQSDFVIVGSGGGGGTIGWLLAKANYRVTILEQGPSWVERQFGATPEKWNPVAHDEELYRMRRPDPKRRLRGAYATFRDATTKAPAKPFDGGWAGSQVGGGTLIWGTWGLRPMPIDFQLQSFFRESNDKDVLADHSVADWMVPYSEFAPYFNVAETLLGVSGNREQVVESVMTSKWFRELSGPRFRTSFGDKKSWESGFEFPCPAMPVTPIGALCAHMMRKAGFKPAPLPVAIVSPGSPPYSTRDALEKALATWPDAARPAFWRGKSAAEIWSARTRDACNQCGFCGEYLCWGKDAPKAGTPFTTLREMELDMHERVDIRPNSQAYQIIWDEKTGRARGVKYLDISDPDHAKPVEILAPNVVLSCGAVQSARLLLLSGYGKRSEHVGRHAMFHMFGLGAKFVLHSDFDGLVHGEFGSTGNTTTFDTYFIEGRDLGPEASPSPSGWVKAGILTSTAKKNPTEDAARPFSTFDPQPPNLGKKLLNDMAGHSRTVELRLNGDDLPHKDNRVELDPIYVDEYGIPVPRISRAFRTHEKRLNVAGVRLLKTMVDDLGASGGFLDTSAPDVKPSGANLSLIGDHQLGTCRMGSDPRSSVVDEWCRLHDAKNVYVIDTSFFPTGFGVNPMVTVVANALRVGTKIVDCKGAIPAGDGGGGASGAGGGQGGGGGGGKAADVAAVRPPTSRRR